MSSTSAWDGQADPTPGRQPDPDALRLAREMIQQDDVMRAILQETLDSSHQDALSESGRTVCGTAARPLPPILRGFATVTLPTCPTTVGGTWHTHITRDQLLTGENSLPDWANVAFGVIDVSIVVGAERSEVVVGSTDRSVMVHELQQVLGAEVESVEGVVEAILDGAVQDPPAARARLRRQLPLAFEVDTGFTDLAEAVRTADGLATLADIEPVDRRFAMVAACPMYGLVARQSFAGDGPFDRFRELARSNAGGLKTASKQLLPPDSVHFRETIWGTAIGFFVSNALSNIFVE